MELAGKVAVVTGGGRGIGLGITRALLQAGAQVLVAQRKPLPSELSHNKAVVWAEVDLAERDGPGQVAAAVEDAFGGVDILVNNAGAMFERELQDMSQDEWDWMMAINVRAPVFLAQSLLPGFNHRGGGCIINIGSIEGIGTNPQHIAYSASKSAVHGLTRSMAVDLGKRGIRCNAIAPGWINSDLSDDYINSQSDPMAARAALNQLHPVGHTGEPDDIGAMAVFLASSGAGFITGQTFVVDGGRTVKLPLSF